jgi:hypothetical protein
MVAKVVREVLETARLRPTHFHKHVPIITAMVFIPSEADIEAEQLLTGDVAWEQADRLAGVTRNQVYAGWCPLEFSS